jgi:hypothetical protein
MIDAKKRLAVFVLHTDGVKIRAISRQFNMARNTVRKIIRQEGQKPDGARSGAPNPDPSVVRPRYDLCKGNTTQVREELLNEEQIDLTWPSQDQTGLSWALAERISGFVTMAPCLSTKIRSIGGIWAL